MDNVTWDHNQIDVVIFDFDGTLVDSEKIKNPSRYIPQSIKKDRRLFNCPQKKPLIPSIKEMLINPPSRSAKLRYVIRNNNEFIFPKDLINKFQSYLDIERIGLKL